MTRMEIAVALLAVSIGVAHGAAAQSGAGQAPLPATPAAPEIIAASGTENVVNAQFDVNSGRRGVVRIGSNYTLAADDTIRDVVVLGADAVIEGHVDRDVVVILGKTQVANTAVIDGSLIVVGGTATVTPGARVNRDLVSVGGVFDAPPEFTPGGDHVVVDTRMLGGRLEGVFAWITRGLLWGRLIVPSLPGIWVVVGLFFLIYLLLSLVFDQPVRASADVLAQRPLSAFVVGLLVLLLTGPVCLLLAVSIVGIAVVPLVLCALLVAWIVGKVGAARWIGAGVLRPSSPESRAQAMGAFTLGFALICLAYMVPVLGFVTWTLLGVIGLGASTLAFLAEYRRENPIPVPLRPAMAVAVPTPHMHGGAMMTNSDASAIPLTEQSTSTVGLPTTSDLASFPHAAFRDRVAAGVLDLILVVFAWQLLDPIARDNAIFVLLLAYHVGFWTWKGTTVGGIICQLRVVRIDGAPLRFVDALVRGLSAIFSLIVVGLGFLWILKDPERQAWHDKIAGTYVVKVPRNWPL
jgi:uncharacterized RDD family membrane protein YckC